MILALGYIGKKGKAMHIVLVEPEIPQNTGNIARTCAATDSVLHLVKPLGFRLEDRYLKRAGLDYWKMMRLEVHDSLQAFYAAYPQADCYYASTKAPRDYAAPCYGPDCFLVFGQETRGLPETLLEAHWDRCIRIPMQPDARSLNLSNSVAVVLYEALRQQGFPGLFGEGRLTGREEDSTWTDYI